MNKTIEDLGASGALALTSLVETQGPGVTPTEKSTLEQVQLVMRDILMALDEVGITLTETVGTTADAIVYLDDNGIPMFRLRFNGALTSSGSIESTAASAVGGFVLKSPDGTRWRIIVNNLGSLSAVLA